MTDKEKLAYIKGVLRALMLNKDPYAVRTGIVALLQEMEKQS